MGAATGTLFDVPGEPVAHKPRQYPSQTTAARRQRRRDFVKSLVGDTNLRQNPKNGFWYYVTDTDKCAGYKRAWPTKCACGCGQTLYRTQQQFRKSGGQAWHTGSRHALLIGEKRLNAR